MAVPGVAGQGNDGKSLIGGGRVPTAWLLPRCWEHRGVPAGLRASLVRQPAPRTMDSGLGVVLPLSIPVGRQGRDSASGRTSRNTTVSVTAPT